MSGEKDERSSNTVNMRAFRRMRCMVNKAGRIKVEGDNKKYDIEERKARVKTRNRIRK